MNTFEVKPSTNYDIIKPLFVEYSQIKGAEGCFVSFEKEFSFLHHPPTFGTHCEKRGLPTECADAEYINVYYDAPKITPPTFFQISTQ